ncbi:hypothetical protein A2U01_0077052, partial [Trifolium medium]|nr:hypothetical protein [Trifolium medium]
AMNDRKRKSQDRGKPYDNTRRGNGGKKQGNGQCYKCGARGHMSYDWSNKDDKCFNCGKFGHKTE